MVEPIDDASTEGTNPSTDDDEVVTIAEDDGADPAEAADGEGEKEPEPPKDDADQPLSGTIGEDDDEADDEPAPTDPKANARWKELKAAEKRLKALEAQQQTKPPATPAALPTLGPKPTLEGVGYDTEKYDADLLKWHAAKAKHDEAEAKAKADAKAVYDAYEAKKKALGAPDFKAKEDIVVRTLSLEQQNLILNKTKDTATLVYLLGKNPSKLAKLAAITDPYDFHAAIRDTEKSMTVTKRQPTTEPEEPIRGGTVRATVDKELQRLEAEADRTNDRTKVIAYKRQQKERQKQK